MNFVNSNRLQWILSGALGAGLALAPALVASAQQTAQQTPTPGQQGQWGPAGPPPDVQNGQIPPPDSSAQDANQPQDQGPSQYPGQTADQTPNQAPYQAPNQAPNQAPGVGYGQAPRPAYQPGQNSGGAYPNNYQGPPPSTQTAPPSGPVTVAAGVLVPIRTSEPLDSKKVKPGDYFQATVAQNVYVGRVLAIPMGAQVTGRVADVKKAGELKGGASIALQLTSLNLGGNTYALATDVFDTSSPGKGAYTAGNTVGGAALGAAIGAIAGGGPGAAIGAIAGTGVGLGASAATPGPRSVVPPESLITFHLTSPATVQPVSAQEAAEIQSSVAPQGRRMGQGYGPGYGPGGPYGPPPGYGPAAAYVAPPPGYAPYPYAYGYPAPYPYVYAYPRPYVYGYPYYYGRWR